MYQHPTLHFFSTRSLDSRNLFNILKIYARHFPSTVFLLHALYLICNTGIHTKFLLMIGQKKETCLQLHVLITQRYLKSHPLWVTLYYINQFFSNLFSTGNSGPFCQLAYNLQFYTERLSCVVSFGQNFPSIQLVPKQFSLHFDALRTEDGLGVPYRVALGGHIQSHQLPALCHKFRFQLIS